MDQLPRLGKRELVFLLLFTCSFVVSVSWRFLFLLVLGMGLRFFIVALPGPSVNYFKSVFERTVMLKFANLQFFYLAHALYICFDAKTKMF